MGLLIDGVWTEQDEARSDAEGRFVQPESVFRNWVTPDGRPGPTGHDGFAAAKGRYHLYVSLACPWAHRALIVRGVKGLEDVIPVSVTHWLVEDQGWTFLPGEGVIPDPLFNSRYLHEIYTRADGHYTGRATVPVLWDRHTQTVVSNESSEIIRMMNSAFDAFGTKQADLYPSPLREQIDHLNERIYQAVNHGVYKVGFAASQQAYEAAIDDLFETLDSLEERLTTSRFLCGDVFTEADIYLFTTLLRFDSVYVCLFKCNKRRITDYKHLWGYTRDIYQRPEIAGTVDLNHIRRHYYLSHKTLNPNGLIPGGPELNFVEEVERGGNVARLLTF